MKESSTSKDAVQEAQKIVEPYEQKHSEKLKHIVSNVATIVSLFIIGLTLVLFAYNEGYASIYNLPAKILPVDLKAYLSLAVTIMMLLIYVFYYITCKHSDRLLAKRGINFLATFYGICILFTLLTKYHFERAFSIFGCIAIAIIIPIVAELIPLIIHFIHRNRKYEPIDLKTKELKKEQFVWEKILYVLYVKNGIFLLVLCICLAPFVGRISARANPDYQTCSYDSKNYAIIAEYEDRVLVQEADINENTITIFTDSYRYLPKDSLEIAFSTYDSVLIQEDS